MDDDSDEIESADDDAECEESDGEVTFPAGMPNTTVTLMPWHGKYWESGNAGVFTFTRDEPEEDPKPFIRE